uniref:G protein-coupled receptor n=1 Tax=Panagrellus redivivus TaxID=6233 RepID=A0A7E4V410_PANRE
MHAINDDIAAVFGLVFNILATWLALHTRVPELREYRRITCQMCFIDLFLLVCTFAVKPLKIVQFGNEYLIVNGYFRKIHAHYGYAAFTVWFFALFFSITSVPVVFVFRCVRLCYNRSFAMKHQMILLAVSALASLAFCVLAYWVYYINGQEGLYLAEALPAYAHDDDGQVRACGMLFPRTIYSYSIVTSVTFLSVGSYSIIIFCSLRIYWHVKTAPKAISKRAHDVQKQLNRLLTIHATIPLFSAVMPSTVLVVAMTFDTVDFTKFTVLVTMFFSWIPAGNAMSVVFFVKAYRQQLLSMICRVCKRRRIPSNNSVTNWGAIPGSASPGRRMTLANLPTISQSMYPTMSSK